MHVCGIENIKTVNLFSEIDAISYVNSVYNDITTIESMDKSMYFKIADELSLKIVKGWGYIPDELTNKKEYDVYFGMVESVYIFSAAKQYQLIRELLYIRKTSKDVSDYIKKAIIVFNKYNVRFLSMELDMAEIQGESARKWLDILKWNNEKN